MYCILYTLCVCVCVFVCRLEAYFFVAFMSSSLLLFFFLIFKNTSSHFPSGICEHLKDAHTGNCLTNWHLDASDCPNSSVNSFTFVPVMWCVCNK